MSESGDGAEPRERSNPDYTKAFSRALKGDFVVLVANPGPEQQKFVVHKDILCQESRYFDRALNGNFKESTKMEMELPDVDVVSLEAALAFCYGGKVAGADTNYDAGEPTAYLVGLWLVADRLLLPKMQNAVMKEPCRALQDGSPLETRTIFKIYENTLRRSVLRKLACHWAAYLTLYWDLENEAEDSDIGNDDQWSHGRENSGEDTEPGRRDKIESCFEKLDGFGVNVWRATRRIRGPNLFLSRETVFAVEYFLLPEEVTGNGRE